MNLPSHRALLWIFAVLPACGLLTAGCQSEPSYPDRTIARVGDQEISTGMLALRVQQQTLENTQYATTPVIAFRQLAESRQYALILAKYGRPVTHEVLTQEADRIRKSTKDAKKLAEFREIFPDEESYLQNYVLPVYVNREIHWGLFLARREFHAQALDTLEKYRLQTRSLTSLASRAQLAANLGLFLRRVTLTRSKSGAVTSMVLGTDPKQPYKPNPSGEKLPIFDRHDDAEIYTRVAELKNGESSDIIEQEYAYGLARRTGGNSKAGTVEFEAISAMKSDYGTWLNQERAAWPVLCIKDRFCEEYVASGR